MFDVKPPETFKAVLTLVGQGREQKLPVVFRHKDREGYADLLKKWADGKIKPVDAVLELVASWEANADLSATTLTKLDKDQPGTLWAIVTGYGQALGVARKGN